MLIIYLEITNVIHFLLTGGCGILLFFALQFKYIFKFY